MIEVVEQNSAPIKVIGGTVDLLDKNVISFYVDPSGTNPMKLIFDDYSSVTIDLKNRNDFSYVNISWGSKVLGKIERVFFLKGRMTKYGASFDICIDTDLGEHRASCVVDRGANDIDEILFEFYKQEINDEF